jgi:hypothetical protein
MMMDVVISNDYDADDDDAVGDVVSATSARMEDVDRW